MSGLGGLVLRPLIVLVPTGRWVKGDTLNTDLRSLTMLRRRNTAVGGGSSSSTSVSYPSLKRNGGMRYN